MNINGFLRLKITSYLNQASPPPSSSIEMASFMPFNSMGECRFGCAWVLQGILRAYNEESCLCVASLASQETWTLNEASANQYNLKAQLLASVSTPSNVSEQNATQGSEDLLHGTHTISTLFKIIFSMVYTRLAKITDTLDNHWLIAEVVVKRLKQ